MPLNCNEGKCLRSERHLLVGFAVVVTADLNCYLPVKPFQKIEQFVRCEAAEMPIHQVRYIGLRNAQNIRDFALFQLLVFKNFEDMESDLRARQK